MVMREEQGYARRTARQRLPQPRKMVCDVTMGMSVDACVEADDQSVSTGFGKMHFLVIAPMAGLGDGLAHDGAVVHVAGEDQGAAREALQCGNDLPVALPPAAVDKIPGHHDDSRLHRGEPGNCPHKPDKAVIAGAGVDIAYLGDEHGTTSFKTA
ncbi:hypothetical protein ACVJBD_002873 [Rhizobium mongolense]